ncbi:MAG: restriction endonuclease subunit S domain-containing protein [Gemmatimonadaceae bacterium]
MLADLAVIKQGYKLFANRVPTSTGDGWRVLQLRDFRDDGEIDWVHVATTNAPESDVEAYYVCAGDVLFAARSPRLGAVLLGADVETRRTAASSHFYLIRCDPEQLVPEYLAWYLNHPRTRAQLQGDNRGTHLPFTPAEVIRRLDIPAIPLARQRDIGALDQLAIRERRLAAQLASLHDDLRAASTWGAAHTR